MSSSKLLEQAIVDAQALRDSAFKNAQATLLEKFAPQIKEAVEKLLEQEENEDPAAAAGAPEDSLAGDIPAGTDFGGAPADESNKGYVAGAAKDVPLAATDGEKLCPCPDDDEDVTLELNLADLADQLKIGKESEEEDVSMQPNLAGMQNQPAAAGGAALTESLELESIELEEENLAEINLDEVLDDAHFPDYNLSDPKELQRQLNSQDSTEMNDEDESEEEIDEAKMGADLKAAARDASYKAEKDKKDDKEEKDKKFRKANMAQKKDLNLEESEDKEESDETDEDEEELKNKEKADLNKDGKLSSYEKKRGQAIEKSMEKQKTNESTVKQLMSTSAQLLKEHQSTIKLVEKKDSQIQKLLEENQRFSSTIEEMSQAFKKLEEVNLLNAKLFYQNQVLKSASLNERQKTHIVEAVSKADSVNEAKAVYETLINSVGGPAEKERSPKSLNEAISKKSSFRLPHKQAEQPHDPNKDRWLKLAGIK